MHFKHYVLIPSSVLNYFFKGENRQIKNFGISDKKRPKMGLFFSYMPKRDLKLLVSPLSIRGMSL